MNYQFQGLFFTISLLLAVTFSPALNSSDEVVFTPAFGVEVGTEVEIETEIETEVETEIETEVETEIETEVEVETEIETEVEVETEVESETKTETKVESETKTETESKIETKSDTTVEMEAISQINIKTSYPKIKTSVDNSFVVQSNQKLYQPGENIKVEGSVWTNSEAKLEGNNMITIQVLDKNGMIVKESNVQLKNDGNFKGVIQLPETSMDGKYTLKSKISSDSSILGTLESESKIKLQSDTGIVVSTPSKVKIQVEGHNDFDVGIASNSKVSKVEFKETEKKVSFQVEGETGTKGVSQISIPKALLSGQISVMLDGKIMASDDVIVTTNTEAMTTLEINYSHSVHIIEVIGTNAVPEFGTITVMILAVAIISIIAVTTKSKLSIMPKI